MRRTPIHLVPIYLPNHSTVLPQLAERLQRTFAVEVSCKPLRFDPETTFDGSRGQYHATGLLTLLLAGEAQPGVRLLGVAGVDLFVPILTFVFGEAQLDGTAAVVSTYRLDNEHYGLPGDERLLLDRLHKEAVHELGHTYGLVHCQRSQCVMRSSTYAEDIDLKSGAFCSKCNTAVK